MSEQDRLVDLTEAFSRPSAVVRQVLQMAETWPTVTVCDARHVQPLRTARQLRPGEVDELVHAHRSGAKLRELAALSNVSAHTVSNHLRARGINTRRDLAPEDVPAAAQLYRAGWSLARVAEKFDTTPNTVRVRLLEVHVRMRDTQGRERIDDVAPS